MPPAASSQKPCFLLSAPVNAPFSCPNKVDAASSFDSSPQSTAMNGPADRLLLACIFSAMCSLPVPLSLVNRCFVPLHPFPQGFQEREKVVLNQLLRDVVLCAQFHRPDGSGHFVIVGHDDVRIVPALLPQFFQQGDAVTVWQAHVGKHDVVLLHLGKQLPCAVTGGSGHTLVSFVFQQPAYIVGIDDVVLNDDYSAHRSASFLAKSTISLPCANAAPTATLNSSSDMLSLWMASDSTFSGCSAFISIHELLK